MSSTRVLQRHEDAGLLHAVDSGETMSGRSSSGAPEDFLDGGDAGVFAVEQGQRELVHVLGRP